MAEITPLSNSAVPIARDEAEALAELFADLQRQSGAALLLLTNRMDALDGDPDLETCRTEDDFTPMPPEIDYGPGCTVSDPGGTESNEDEPHQHSTDYGPGCPIADPGGCQHDDREQTSSRCPEYGIDQRGPPIGGWR